MQRTSGRVVEATAVGPIRVADALGWTSSALGAPMTIAPRRSCGPSVKDDRKAVLWTAGSACASTRRDRERDRQPAAAVGMWSRVADDTMDLALLAAAWGMLVQPAQGGVGVLERRRNGCSGARRYSTERKGAPLADT
jgi:hypothetical protein